MNDRAQREPKGNASPKPKTPHYGHERSLYQWPYLIARLPDATWLAVNRSYKPLGERRDGWVDYETHPARTPLPGLTLCVARQLAIDPIDDAIPDNIYLYDDTTSPRRSTEHRGDVASS